MINSPQFLVSVANILLRDTVADQVVLKGKSLISSALKQTLASQEIRGGQNNPIIFLYQHDKKLDIAIDSATFDESYLALSNGTSITNAAKNFYTIDEVVVLSSGTGTLANTPVGSVYVQKADNTIATVTPSGNSFTVSGGANTTVKATYRSSQTVDSITIDATSIPSSFELSMSAKIFQSQGQTAELQILVPNYRISGNFDLTFSANGVSGSKMDGMALVNDADGSYATVMIKPVGSAAISYSAIAATPSSVALSTSNTTSQLTVLGIRGSLYSNVVITSSSSFTSSATSIATVSAGGLVSRVAAGTSYITITNGSLTDTVQVTCT